MICRCLTAKVVAFAGDEPYMKKLNIRRLAPSTFILACGLLALNTQAQSQYFAPVTTGNTYSWDDPNWNSGASGNTAPYTLNWTAGSFARFYNGASANYTVTVNASEQMTGLYNNSSGSTLNINDAGNGTGSLDVINAVQGFLAASGTSIHINAPITGDGGVAPELSGSIYLGAANSYTGGTELGDSGNTLTYFNNNLSFSTGSITLNRTGIANFSTLLSYGSSTITLANNFQIGTAAGTGTALNFASSANTPVVSSGTWSLGTANLNLRNAGGSTAPLTLSGAISGSGLLALSANGAGNKTILSGANPFTGTVIVTGSGGTYGGNNVARLTLGAANTLAASSQVVMAGGVLDPDGFHHAMSSTTLGLSASSTLDFTSGTGELDFANSSGVSWTAATTLNLLTTGLWKDSGDALRLGTDATGLSASQLAQIEFNGTDLGQAALNPQGYVYDVAQVPEPSTLALGLLGGLGLLRLIRRRAA